MRPTKEILERLEQCFEKNELQVFLLRPSDGTRSTAVKVVHGPSGFESVVADHPTLAENKADALAQLLSAILREPAST